MHTAGHTFSSFMPQLTEPQRVFSHAAPEVSVKCLVGTMIDGDQSDNAVCEHVCKTQHCGQARFQLKPAATELEKRGNFERNFL